MIKKIDHINISVTNLESAKKFFIDLFGFHLLDQADLEGEWIEKITHLKGVKASYAKLALPATQTNLELIQYHHPLGEKDPKISQAHQIGFRHMAFQVKDMESLYEKLKKAGVEFFSEIQLNNQKKKICYFKGPDDVLLELAEYME